MTDELSFDDRMQKIARDFLQTVVIVDDRGLEPSAPVASPEVPDDDPLGAEVVEEVVRLTPPSPGDEPADRAHGLDAKRLTVAFAQLGLVCGVIDPDPGDEEVVVTRALGAARTADLLVLDWVMLGQFGHITLQILDGVLDEAAGATKRRLRLIAIYTGEEDLEKITEDVAQRLEKHYGDCDLERTGNFAVSRGPVRVIVLAKPYARVSAEDRQVAFEDLPSRLVGEFALFARGIVRAVGLASLAALRHDSHRLLHVLHPELDPGYLADRSRLPRPSDAERQLLEIVLGEVRAILEDNEVTLIAELPGLEAWATDAVASSSIGKTLHNKGLDVAQIMLLLRDGLAEVSGGKDKDARVAAAKAAGIGLPAGASGRAQASRAFCESKQDAIAADARYAHRVLCRTHYGRPRRHLDLGTVVAVGQSEYLLCMQPGCDATTLTGPTAFPFLPLKRVNDGDPADFVVMPVGLGWVRLKLKRQPSGLRQVTFAPEASHQPILAAVTGDRHVFKDIDGVEHEWVSQLRPGFAQRAAHELGHQFSRVAVDEPEALRISRR